MAFKYLPFGYRTADVEAELARLARSGQRQIDRAQRRLHKARAENEQLRQYLRLLEAEVVHLEALIRERHDGSADPPGPPDPAGAELDYLRALRDHYRDLRQETLAGVMRLIQPFLKSKGDH